MDRLFFSILIGLAAGIIDAAPMMLKKLPRSSILSAFFQYLFLGIIIINCNIPHVAWWLQGGLIAVAMTLPLAFLIAKFDKKSLPIIFVNAAVLGTLISIAGHFLI